MTIKQRQQLSPEVGICLRRLYYSNSSSQPTKVHCTTRFPVIYLKELVIQWIEIVYKGYFRSILPCWIYLILYLLPLDQMFQHSLSMLFRQILLLHIIDHWQLPVPPIYKQVLPNESDLRAHKNRILVSLCFISNIDLPRFSWTSSPQLGSRCLWQDYTFLLKTVLCNRLCPQLKLVK